MAERGPVGEAPIDPVTERTARAYLQSRIRALEGRIAALEASRELHRERADVYRARVELAHARIGQMSRVAKMWYVARNSIRRPRRLAVLPIELIRIARGEQARGVPGSFVPTPTESADEAEAVAAEARRVETLQAVGDRLRSGATRPVGSLRIALIADDPLRAVVEAECHVIAVTPDRWRAQLEADLPDLLLVESAGRGNGGAWEHRIGWEAHPQAIGLVDLRALLAGCHELGIPTVFWDTRGRRAWRRHRSAAVLFDQLFSVDPVVAEGAAGLPERRYPRADVLGPAAQPRLHHPIRGLDPGDAGDPGDPRDPDGTDRRPAYLGGIDHRLPLLQREALEGLLEAAAPFRLAIHDPDVGYAPGGSPLPPGLREHLVGRLRERDVPSLLRRYPLFLAGGHDPDAPAALPDRLPSLLSAGRAVVSTGGGGIDDLAGGLVRQVAGREDAAAAIGELLESQERRRAIRISAIPRIAAAHTIRLRLADIARSVGIAVDAQPEPLGLLLLHDVDDRAATAQLVGSIAAQRRRPGEVVVGSRDPDAVGRELVALLGERLAGIPVRLVAQDDAPRGERIRRLAAVGSCGRVAIVESRHRYGPAHLAELAAIADGPAPDVVGSCRHATLDGRIVAGPEDLVVSAVHPHAALVGRHLLLERGWPDDPGAALAVFADWSASGVRIVAAAGDGFVADPRLVMRIPEGAAA